MLNEKMYNIAHIIKNTIIKVFPKDYLNNCVFSGKITLDDIVKQIMVDCCKYAYDNTSEKHSLNYYLGGATSLDDSERMTKQRIIDYIRKRRLIYQEYINESGYDIQNLTIPKKENIEDKLAGHSFTEFQFWEINNVYDMQLVKAIVDKKISKKNFKNEVFENYVQEYDNLICKLRNESNDDALSLIFDFLKIFTLEWKYSFDFFYEIADEMVKYNVKEIDNIKERLIPFSGGIKFYSSLIMINPSIVNGIIFIESRMIVQRRKYIKDIVTLPFCDLQEEIRYFMECYTVIALIEKRMILYNIPIYEWFITNTCPDDWKSVFLNYNIFDAFIADKKFSNKTIRHIKEIYDAVSLDYKNPKNRS